MRTRSSFRDGYRHAVTRRAVLACAAAPLLARCSSDPNSDTSSLTRYIGRSLGVLSGGSVTLDEVARVPFASLGFRVGSGSQALLVLATRAGGSTLWTSASHVAIEIQSGRIMRTAGLPHNLSGAVVTGPDPFDAGLQNLHASIVTKWTLDFADRNAFGVLIESTVEPAGVADIDVLGTGVRTVRATERGVCQALGWTFTNDYWTDPESGIVWRSEQNIHPDLDVVQIELFRPPKPER